MLLETSYKIIAIILHARLLLIEESLDHESPCGFRPGFYDQNGFKKEKRAWFRVMGPFPKFG